MTAWKLYVLTCNGLGAAGPCAAEFRPPLGHELARDVRELAAAEGWTASIGERASGARPVLDFCPRCSAAAKGGG
jgi:hypothetical protein